MAQHNFVIYVCTFCGRTVQVPNPTTWLPDLICKCGWPDYVSQMILCYPNVQTEKTEKIGEDNDTTGSIAS